MKLKDSSLDHKYTCSLLIYILESKKTKINITDPLNDISKDYRMIKSSFLKLEADELVNIRRIKSPKRRYLISLTSKGLRIAKLLKKIEKEFSPMN